MLANFVGMTAVPATAGVLSGVAAPPGKSALPDRTNFRLDHVYLDAAYVHPMGQMTYQAIEAFLHQRVREIDTPWPTENPRDEAVALFARLINADPRDIAVVPSTMVGENLIAAAVGLDTDHGVVTDAFHYSPQIYGELHARGVPLAVAMPRANRIEVADLARLIGKDTRLVAVSAVSSDTGFRHDLKAVCEAAHRRGAMVYADIIQAAGAVPIDVKDSGVDFCCSGAYKWMMGDFGAAFLYVRPDRLKDLQRVQFGWRQYKTYVSHAYPFDPPGDTAADYTLGADTAGRFEVGTPAWGALAGVAAGLKYVEELTVDKIVRYRAPLMERLQQELPRRGYLPLTPSNVDTPAIAFARADLGTTLGPALKKAGVRVSVHRNRIRVAPSVYNDMTDIEALLQVIGNRA